MIVKTGIYIGTGCISNIEFCNRPDGGFCLAVDGTEGRKIVFSEQILRSFLHILDIERANMGCAVDQERREVFALPELISVMLAAAFKTRLKAVGSSTRIADGDFGGRKCIEGNPESFGFVSARRIECCDLPFGVNTGIGAARRSDFGGRMIDLRDGVLKTSLDGSLIVLTLPSGDVLIVSAGENRRE